MASRAFSARLVSADSSGIGIPADLLTQKIQVADHDSEKIVEVMRQAAGELADRLHLLALPQLVLQRLAGRDVLERSDHDADGAVLGKGRGRRELDVEEGAILALASHHQVANAFARELAAEQLLEFLPP